MRLLRKTAAFLIVAAVVILKVQAGYSYAYNPWTGMTGQGVLGINPFVYYGIADGSLGADLVGSYGFTPNIDLFVDFAGVGILPNFTYNYSWGMLRYDIGGNNIIALQASQFAVTPHYHFFMENDVMALEANIYASFTYADFGTPVLGAYLAPVFKAVKDTLHLYVEVDPAYTIGGSFALTVVPGIWLGLGGAGQISLACSLGDVLTGLTPTVALWYFLPVNLTGN